MKQRLTITLSEGVLKQVDALVDRVHVRNRSHAIEHLLTKSLSPKIDTAVFLCGGSVHQQTAPLTEVAGKPSIIRMVEQLRDKGITRVLISLGDKSEKLQKILGTGEKFGVYIHYHEEKKPLGTGGALKVWQNQLDEVPFLALHGDVLSTVNLADMSEFHQKEDALLTVAVKPQLSKREYGQVYLQGNHVVTFAQRGQEGGISIINSGIYVVDPSILGQIPEGKFYQLEDELMPGLAKQNNLRAYFFQGMWFDLTDPLQLADARKRWLQ